MSGVIIVLLGIVTAIYASDVVVYLYCKIYMHGGSLDSDRREDLSDDTSLKTLDIPKIVPVLIAAGCLSVPLKRQEVSYCDVGFVVGCIFFAVLCLPYAQYWLDGKRRKGMLLVKAPNLGGIYLCLVEA